MKDYQIQIEDILKNADLLEKKYDLNLKQYNHHIEKLNENSNFREKEIDTVMDNLIGIINKRREFLKQELFDQIGEEEMILNVDREMMAVSSAEIQAVLLELKSTLMNIHSDILVKKKF